MQYNELFTISINAKHRGQDCVTVHEGRVTKLEGTSPTGVIFDLDQYVAPGAGATYLAFLLGIQAYDYQIQTIVVKGDIEEATIEGSSLYNQGRGTVGTIGTSGLVGVANYVQLSGANTPRKYSRGVFVPLTNEALYNPDGYVNTGGMQALEAYANALLSLSVDGTRKWTFHVRNKATGANDVVSIATITNWVSLMRRRTPRYAP